MGNGSSITIKDIKAFMNELTKNYPDLEQGSIDGITFIPFTKIGLNDDYPIMDRIEIYCKSGNKNNVVHYKITYYADENAVIERTTSKMIKTRVNFDEK